MRTLLLACALLGAGCFRPQPSETVAEANVRKTSARWVLLSAQAQREAGIVTAPTRLVSVPLTLEAAGRITPDENRTWRVGAVTEGRIVSVFVAVGDRVAQNQVLARMDSHDIHESRAAYRKALAEVARLRSSEDYARRLRDRARRLYELKAGSLQQLEDAETELRNVQAQLTHAEADLDRARRHLVDFLQIPAETPEPGPGADAHRQEDLIPIKSPANGIVVARNVTPGTVVNPSTDLFVLSDLSSLWMIATVAEEHLARLKPGLPVWVTVHAYPSRRFEGRIAWLGDQLDPTTRTVQVRVTLLNHDGFLKPEMYARAEILLGRSAPALFVPQEAVQEVDGQTVVFVQTAPERFELRTVRTARTVDAHLEILSGLRPGEVIAVRGSYILKSELLKATLSEE